MASLSPICDKCSSMEIDNNKTKNKMDQLRLVMQQRRERREARKMRSAPYGGRIDIGGVTPSTAGNPGDSGVTIQAAVDGIPIVEQVNIA